MNINSLLPHEIAEGFRGKQVFSWLHKQLVTDFALMTNLPKADREKLSENFTILVPKIVKIQKSFDGTKKYLLNFGEDKIETVLIQDKSGRKTICASTQIGCPLTCRICATGKMGFKRNLTADEIIAQIELVYRENDGVENVVFMGMGEPLLNLENVLKTIEVINHEKGLNIGARKITVSTAGIPHKIIELGSYKKQIRLAVSLNSPFDEKRSAIMPINKKYPLPLLFSAIKKYIDLSGRRVTFEYVLIRDFNDRERDVEALWKLCKDLNVNINLIPLNPTGKSKYAPSSQKISEWFANQLKQNGINAVVRRSKGMDILGACGQLAAKGSGQPPVPPQSRH
ncbi:23S rRNA (adenine(2503)-C(2))-methyltransferase [candidate division WOR-1 bacterium RIFOXYA12_FULL_43_27]|uniref:Probable dual-specificity RNA methyltransferase RlmN n=1 Tax=candidate division WOR-1 bacterium RIFOXYC2_FULL_46_14 TaxID=1802587 RepID=A0A1F4U7X3_UNCSA|nr:MAG: 23S rRNA (adenine(2503)-C(2))-methyltransferase [candidate division WOR-1 bacterium RIFOXYA12_FULL_43_27]OGC19350.1 MAG: 23S rRNA (adenine(2503)-C(2))-methyltransferase [candidate division WOR-1 bacterium RIFOXYB2_FULL_46_45]OGC30339.1 MAG: 23S rRNA (adenine(2503)-C(2))-methyltransferase [candidate division WOR-1 bacterium RIFOXYA2_FULL_46_56]OGC40940.1 MAG: 23S rRNA (adenine(2503)-C(2))-methyltransferase [candidate division WOR-1 bacterium RIFOXYC2_FULL_46_14]